jgi:small subunit ribosomal protein S20
MPIIKSAKKKMRRDYKKTVENKIIKDNVKGLLKNARREPTQEAYNKVASALDKAVKVHLLHANNASRLKSRLSKIITVK